MDWVNYYPQAWPTARCRPDVCICTVQYDFVDYYKDRINPIKGFTKTQSDPATVQGWKCERQSSGAIEVFWQPEARLSAKWLGVDSQENSSGFVVLRNGSRKGPRSVPPGFLTEYRATMKTIKRDLSCPAIKQQLHLEGKADALPWLMECVDSGKIPIARILEEKIPPGEIGRLVELACGASSVQVRAMDLPPPKSAEELFWLPVGVKERMRERALKEAGLGAEQKLPRVRQGEAKQRSKSKRKSRVQGTRAKDNAEPRGKRKGKTKRQNTPARPVVSNSKRQKRDLGEEKSNADFLTGIEVGDFAVVAVAGGAGVIKVLDVKESDRDGVISCAGQWCGSNLTGGDITPDRNTPKKLGTFRPGWTLSKQRKGKHVSLRQWSVRCEGSGKPWVNEQRFDKTHIVVWGKNVLTRNHKLTKYALKAMSRDPNINWSCADTQSTVVG